MKRINHRFSPEFIDHLSTAEIYVFGSNVHGPHSGGCARIARVNFGAEWETTSGPTGRCYAIPVTYGNAWAMRQHVDEFIEYAKEHPMNRFLLTRIGCGITGFGDAEVAPMFIEALGVPNIAIPERWLRYMQECTTDTYSPVVREPMPGIIDETVIRQTFEANRYAIGAGIRDIIPSGRIRYVRDRGEFGYADIADCFYLDDSLCVWEREEQYGDADSNDIAMRLFSDECQGRGYARRVIFAGADTGYRDSSGEALYTGDVVEIERPQSKVQLALGTTNGAYSFALGEHVLELGKTGTRRLTRMGTVMFRLTRDTATQPMLDERVAQYNNINDSAMARHAKNQMAKQTPSFDQSAIQYIAKAIFSVK
jgi:hypothetical protein